MANEQRVPGKLDEHARLDAVFRVGAAVEILRRKAACLWHASMKVGKEHRTAAGVSLPFLSHQICFSVGRRKRQTYLSASGRCGVPVSAQNAPP